MKIGKLIRNIVVVLAAVLVLFIGGAMVVYSPEYVIRTLRWREADALDWQKFPVHPLDPAPVPFHFEQAPDPQVAKLFADIAGTDDWEGFLEANETQALIVIRNGAVVYERYFNGIARDSIVTSFSVAKSFTSALVGIAIAEGHIGSVEDPITDYLPELAERDVGFSEITIQDLLRMSSGLEYVEFRPLLFNSDDILTSYYPDQREISLTNTNIIDPPGEYFLYNKYHPQLLGMILERTTGMTVTEFLQTRIWTALGMEYPGSWSIDSEASGFEKMETGVNARAIDFAKFGVLFLDGGRWAGGQVVPQAWVAESTAPWQPADAASYYPEYFASIPGAGYYGYMWWGLARPNGAYDFSAEGNLGQYIYVSPAADLVIVRNGFDYGIDGLEWLRIFYEFAGSYKK
jgi:CubicO group peptidase (beta-lactamase class C family)